MSSPTKLNPSSNSGCGKRELDLIPFNSQLEVIERALLSQSRVQSNTNQYVNTHRYGYNNGSNNHKNTHNQHQNQNQNQQNKYALAAVAAAAAVQHQQGHLLHQSNRNSYSQQQPQVHTQPRQYNDYSPYMYASQKVGLDKLGEHGDMSNASLLSDNNSLVPYDFHNTVMTSSNGNNNSSSSPTTVSSNQPSARDLQSQQPQPQPQFQNLTQASKPGFMFDPMNSDNISNSPTSLNPQHSASSSKTNKNSPPNLFMSTPNLPQPTVNASTTSASTANNFLNSPSLLPSVNGISNNWGNGNTNAKTINHSSIWGANPSLSSSNLDSNSGNNISLGNNFNGSMW